MQGPDAGARHTVDFTGGQGDLLSGFGKGIGGAVALLRQAYDQVLLRPGAGLLVLIMLASHMHWVVGRGLGRRRSQRKHQVAA